MENDYIAWISDPHVIRLNTLVSNAEGRISSQPQIARFGLEAAERIIDEMLLRQGKCRESNTDPCLAAMLYRIERAYSKLPNIH